MATVPVDLVKRRKRPRILLIECDPQSDSSVLTALSHHGDVIVMTKEVACAESAERLEQSWHALVIEIGGRAGAHRPLLAQLRAGCPEAPALVIVGSVEQSDINGACLLGAQLAVRPLSEGILERFVRSAAVSAAPVESAASRWQTRYRLSNAESDILLGAARGEDRESIAVRRKSSPFTVKTHVASLLRKTLDASLHQAVERLLREALNTRP
jgi:DNA-binding NarL/FixJ family response regulator